ncbi:MAG: sodium:solute symporter family protein [Oscillospiraceae bacterium]|nr:sodium:solute symporter family protein [Oscillospiraceae bacterium]
MDHGQISIWDLAIVAIYLLAMVLVGVYAARRIKSSGDYYVAGRSFGPLVLMATVCATIIGGSGLMGRAGVAYSSGFKAVMTALPYLLGMFIFSGIAGKISDIGMKYNISSIPELFEMRFGKTAKLILSAMIAFTMMGTVASQVTATATIVNMLGGEIGLSYEVGALIACVVFMIYTATSGLFGVVYTDVLQFYILILFVYILIPAASLINVGGISNFTANLDPALVKPYLDGSILGDIVTYLVFTMAGAEMWQRAFAAKNRKAAKEGMFLGTAVYGVTIFLVFFMGIVAHQIIGDDVLAQYGSTDAVVPALAIKVLPIGLTGVALAGMLSVIMSTADSYLLVSVQTCVRDIGKTLHPEMSEKTELRLSRLFSVILPLGALVIALYIKNAYNILMFAWTFYAAAAGIPAFAALFWKKATNQGIIAGMVSGFAVCIGWKLLGQPFGLGSAVPGTIACAIALAAVSLATYKKYPPKTL